MTPTQRTMAATTSSHKAKPAPRPSGPGASRPAAGLEDVTHAVRVLARNSRSLIADAGEVLEREVSMAVAMSERVRDEAVSKEMLKEARALRVHSDIRDSAHRVVDLVADAVGVASISVIRFAERMADEPRPPLGEVDDTTGVSANA